MQNCSAVQYSPPLGENNAVKERFSTLFRAMETPLGINGESNMKRVGNLWEEMLSDENIERAIINVNKSHRWIRNHQPNKTVMWVESTTDERIKELRQIILDGFEPTELKVKRRYDRNAKKWRDIAEPKLYPDQYVHHILIQVLEPIMMRGMDAYCCGSIKGRGSHWGVKKIQKWMKDDIKGTRWCVELDIYHFYEQLQPGVVMDRMRHLIKDRSVLDLIERVMKHGVTIGAYFSQWFANTVLQPLDAVIRKYDVKHYLRYMDNFTVFASNKRVLRKVVNVVRRWLEKHQMMLKGNWQYFKTKVRMPNALGYRYGHGYTIIRKGRLLSLKRQVASYYRQQGNVSPKFAMSLLARISGLLYCDSRHIFEKIIPKGMQKTLKNIVRVYQTTSLVSWELCMMKYMERKAV